MLFRSLADYTNPEYALIITEHVWRMPTAGDNRWHQSNQFEIMESATIRNTFLTPWFNNPARVGAALRNQAVNYRFADNSGNATARGAEGSGHEVNTANGMAGPWGPESAELNNGSTWRCQRPLAFTTCVESGDKFSRAISSPVLGNSTGEAFILSVTEVNTFFGANNAITAAERIGRGGSAHGWSDGTNETARAWWTRSAGASDPMRIVSTTGNFGNNTATATDRAVRPALWVRR